MSNVELLNPHDVTIRTSSWRVERPSLPSHNQHSSVPWVAFRLEQSAICQSVRCTLCGFAARMNNLSFCTGDVFEVAFECRCNSSTPRVQYSIRERVVPCDPPAEGLEVAWQRFVDFVVKTPIATKEQVAEHMRDSGCDDETLALWYKQWRDIWAKLAL